MRKRITLSIENKVIKFCEEEAKRNNMSLSRYVENILLKEMNEKIKKME
jgi:predicted HicB family RNase H-like nuclease